MISNEAGRAAQIAFEKLDADLRGAEELLVSEFGTIVAYAALTGAMRVALITMLKRLLARQGERLTEEGLYMMVDKINVACEVLPEHREELS